MFYELFWLFKMLTRYEGGTRRSCPLFTPDHVLVEILRSAKFILLIKNFEVLDGVGRYCPFPNSIYFLRVYFYMDFYTKNYVIFLKEAVFVFHKVIAL